MSALNSPQAKDDLYDTTTGFLVVSENRTELTISTASLTANDPGDGVKTFYGLGIGSDAKIGTSAKGASLFIRGGTLVYDPNGRFDPLDIGQTAEDTFTYTVQLGKGVLSTATVTVLVKGVNDKPNGRTDSFTLQANQTATGENVLANDEDVDAGDSLTASLVTGPQNGTLTLNPDGSFTYTPKVNYYGNDTFTYRVFDGTEYSEPITVTFYVRGEPSKTVFGAIKGGIIIDHRYQAGDHHDFSLDYNSYAEAAGYRDLLVSVPNYPDHNQRYHFEANNLDSVGTQFEHRNANVSPSQVPFGVDANGNPLSYTSSEDTQINSHFCGEGILEFDISDVVGPVSRATFKFESAQSHAHDSLKPWDEGGAPETFSLSVYVYSGDNSIDFNDSGAGTLAGTATIFNAHRTANYGPQLTTVTLDTAAVNAILSKGDDYLGIRLASAIRDIYANSQHSVYYEFANNINAATSSLEFIYP